MEKNKYCKYKTKKPTAIQTINITAPRISTRTLTHPDAKSDKLQRHKLCNYTTITSIMSLICVSKCIKKTNEDRTHPLWPLVEAVIGNIIQSLNMSAVTLYTSNHIKAERNLKCKPREPTPTCCVRNRFWLWAIAKVKKTRRRRRMLQAIYRMNPT